MAASNEQMAGRVDRFEKVLADKGLLAPDYLSQYVKTVDEDWTAANGARIVVRAWTDPAYKQRLLADGTAAARELGFDFPKHHRHFVVLENEAALHNVICCTLCSCTAFSIVGMAPGWYKEPDYRARIVRESRAVLRELGLDLPAEMKLKIWDTTADTRYMVLPYRPPHTAGWSEDKLLSIIDQDSLIGARRLEPPYAASTAAA